MTDRRYISVILPLRLGGELCYWTNDSDLDVGTRVCVPVSGKEYVGVVIEVDIAPGVSPAKIKEIVRVEKDLPPVSDLEIRLWRQIAQYYMCTVGEVCKAAYPSGKISSERVAARKKKSALTEDATSADLTAGAFADIPSSESGASFGGITLSEEQSRAEEEILAAFSRGRTVLLCGVAGSGKTEIYIRQILRTIAAGKNVLYLIPEIALTRQLETRLRKVFGKRLLVFHSKETPARRRQVEDEVRTTEGYIVLGTRSALFLPHHSLGLVVVDEEHDSSYKQDAPAPRYNGRDVALMLAALHSEAAKPVAGIPVPTKTSAAPTKTFAAPTKTSAAPTTPPVSPPAISATMPHSGLNTPAAANFAAPTKTSAAPTTPPVSPPAVSATMPHSGLNTPAAANFAAPTTASESISAASTISLGSTPAAPPASHCNVILGSATPSLESLYNCTTGKYTQVRLDGRYYRTENSEIEIIDTKAERRKRGMHGSFSRKLIDRIKACIGGGGQVMILRTRRGYSPVLQCSDCGSILRCPHCNVSLVYHKDVERIRCHHCGYSLLLPSACPECGGLLRPLGAGTQKIEEEAAALFPSARIARLDSDVMQNPKEEKEIIRSFSNGGIDILIGTQILAKGFDFERLSLVAVLQTDTLLSMQDFRADEKALQTLTQFRGRCGRRNSRGRLVIQTALSGHPVYAALSEGVNDLRSERIGALLKERERFGYPPFTRLINITIRHHDESRAKSLADRLALELGDFRVDGPFAPSTGVDSDYHVRMLRIFLAKDRTLASRKVELRRILDTFAAKEKCPDAINVDVDPA